MSRFVADEVERAQLPVAILGGFLGSGKTTLLNALLRHPAMAGTAVAINEFGEVPIDQHLVEADSGAGPDRTVTMAKPTAGALCSVLLGMEYLQHDDELMIANADQWIDGPIDGYDAQRDRPDRFAQPGIGTTVLLSVPKGTAS